MLCNTTTRDQFGQLSQMKSELRCGPTQFKRLTQVPVNNLVTLQPITFCSRGIDVSFELTHLVTKLLLSL